MLTFSLHTQPYCFSYRRRAWDFLLGLTAFGQCSAPGDARHSVVFLMSTCRLASDPRT
jgi:hypothetical protein